MQQYALELAIKKAKRYGYDKSYIPELYEEYMQSLKLQSQNKLLDKPKKHNDLIE